MTLRIPGIVCACGSDDVFAVKPGTDPGFAPGDIMISRPAPDTGWCRACWPWRFAALGPLGVAAGMRTIRSTGGAVSPGVDTLPPPGGLRVEGGISPNAGETA